MASRPRGKSPVRTSPVLGMSAALIGGVSDGLITEDSWFNHTIEVWVSRIAPDPRQARQHFDEASIAALAASLKTEGQLQPVLLRRDPEREEHWILVAGERRWRAAKLLGWRKLLAMVHGRDAEIAGLIENLQRVDLSPVEEARGINRLITERGWTQEQAARALGKPKSDVSGTLRILRLPEAVLDEVLTSEHAPSKNVLVEMARIDDPALLRRLAGMARDGTLTVKAIRALRDPALPPAPRDAAPPPPARERPWPALRKAGEIVGGLAAAGTRVSEREAAALRELRSAIDRVLATHEAPAAPGNAKA